MTSRVAHARMTPLRALAHGGPALTVALAFAGCGGVPGAGAPSPSPELVEIQPEAVIEVDQSFLIAASENEVWATFEQGVVRIDPGSNTTTSIPLSLSINPATGLVVTETDVWVADFYRGSVFRVDRETDEVLDEIAVAEPRALFFEGGSLWGFSSASREMFRIDPSTNEVVERLDVGGVAQPALGSWWVASGGLHEVRRLEPGTTEVIETIAVPAGAGTCSIFPVSGVEGTGDLLATGCNPPPDEDPMEMAVIDPSSNSVVATVDVDGTPRGVVIGGEWWLVQDSTSSRPGEFAHIDPETWTVDRVLSAGADFGGAAVVAHDALWVAMDPFTGRGEVLRFSLEPFR